MANIDFSRFTAVYIIVAVYAIIFLTVRAIAYFSQDSVTVKRFPPWLSPCPDYWTYDGNNKCIKPPNSTLSQGLPKCNAVHHSPDYKFSFSGKNAYNTTEGEATVDFSNMDFPQKCNWSKACEVYWQGISDRPCTADSFKQYTS